MSCFSYLFLNLGIDLGSGEPEWVVSKVGIKLLVSLSACDWSVVPNQGLSLVGNDLILILVNRRGKNGMKYFCLWVPVEARSLDLWQRKR